MRTLVFLYLVALTGLRAVDVVYLLTRKSTNLPIIVFVFSIILVLYGFALILRQLVHQVRWSSYRRFYSVNALVTAFHLIYVSLQVPLALTRPEVLLVGTVLQIVIDVCMVYFCQQQMNKEYISVDLERGPKNKGEDDD